MSEQPPAPPAPQPVVAAQPHAGERVPNGRARLVVAALLFVAWLSWLGWTALNKPRGPIVSRGQAAGATLPVVAELTAGEDGKQRFLLRPPQARGELLTELKERRDRAAIRATVVESLRPGGPDPGAVIAVANLPEAVGFDGPGRYLLLLNRDDGRVEQDAAYYLAKYGRAPGGEVGDVPRLYPWTEATAPDLRKQVQKLFP